MSNALNTFNVFLLFFGGLLVGYFFATRKRITCMTYKDANEILDLMIEQQQQIHRIVLQVGGIADSLPTPPKKAKRVTVKG